MRNEEEIRAEIDAAVTEYRANAGELTGNQVAAFNKELKAMQIELSAVLSKGANPCECGNEVFAPMGMIKTHAYMDRGVEMPTVYEVGCVHCQPFIVEREDGYDVAFSDGKKGKFKRRSFSARALSVKQAVANWNEGKWVEDNRFEYNIPGVSPTARQDADGVWHLEAV